MIVLDNFPKISIKAYMPILEFMGVVKIRYYVKECNKSTRIFNLNIKWIAKLNNHIRK